MVDKISILLEKYFVFYLLEYLCITIFEIN